jgi:hypothetical protein
MKQYEEYKANFVVLLKTCSDLMRHLLGFHTRNSGYPVTHNRKASREITGLLLQNECLVAIVSAARKHPLTS